VVGMMEASVRVRSFILELSVKLHFVLNISYCVWLSAPLLC